MSNIQKHKIELIKLNSENIQSLRNQILIVLADYQSCEAKAYEFGTSERVRIEVADRIIDNLKIIGGTAKR